MEYDGEESFLKLFIIFSWKICICAEHWKIPDKSCVFFILLKYDLDINLNGDTCRKYDLYIEDFEANTYSELNHESVNDAPDHRDKVKGVPVVFEVALKKKKNRKISWGISFFKINAEVKDFVEYVSS